MFIYCGNNPLNRTDSSGMDSEDDDKPFDSTPEEEVFSLGGGSKGGMGYGKGRTTLYRSVSTAEAEDISQTGRFNISTGMQCKQFGFSYSEVSKFGSWAGQSTVVSVSIPTDTLGMFDSTWVDPFIFKSGTLTVWSELLPLFNALITGTINFWY